MFPPLFKSEPSRRASFCFRGFFLSILGRCIGFERTKQARSHIRYFVHRSLEGNLVRLRRFVHTAYFANELKRSGTNLFGSYRRVEIEESFDITAHFDIVKLSRDEGQASDRRAAHVELAGALPTPR